MHVKYFLAMQESSRCAKYEIMSGINLTLHVTTLFVKLVQSATILLEATGHVFL